MAYSQFTPEQVETLGERIYQTEILDRLDASSDGKFVAIDVTSRSFAVGDNDLAATRHLLKNHPDAVIYAIRVGHKAAYTLGGHFIAANA